MKVKVITRSYQTKIRPQDTGHPGGIEVIEDRERTNSMQGPLRQFLQGGPARLRNGSCQYIQEAGIGVMA